MTTAQVDALVNRLDAADQASSLQIRAQTAEAMLASLRGRAAVFDTVQRENQNLQVQVDYLRTLANGATAVQEPVLPALDEAGKPLGEFKLFPVDPQYTLSRWIEDKIAPRLDRHGIGRKIFGITGPAGVGKTKGLEQLAARKGLPAVIINCKGDNADDWIAYREVTAGPTGSVTSWKPGRLTQAIIDAGDKACMIVLDELDMAAESFKYLCLSILDMSPSQRRVDAACGQFPVGSNIQFFAVMNGNGTNPSSRHRGSLPQALLNRLTWVQVPMITPDELTSILANIFPAERRAVVASVAATTVTLMTAANRNELDIDASIRTSIKCLEDWSMGATEAWAGALTDAIEDQLMREKAQAIISTGSVS
jgi:hypothetical protein